MSAASEGSPHDQEAPSAAGASSANESRRDRSSIVRTIVASVLLTAIATGTVAVMAGYALSREAPVWWRSVGLHESGTVKLAESVEQAVINRIFSHTPDGEAWRVAVQVKHANAWLNERLPRWVESRDKAWPQEVVEVQANFEDGRLSLAARLRFDDAEQIIAATFTPRINEAGEMWLEQPRARAGRLDIPYGWTISKLRAWLPPEFRESEGTQRVLDAMSGKGPLFEMAALKLDDGRRVRLLDLEPQEGRLILTCVRERSDFAAARDE